MCNYVDTMLRHIFHPLHEVSGRGLKECDEHGSACHTRQQAQRVRGRARQRRTQLRHPPWLVCTSLGSSALSWARFLKGCRSTTWPISVLYTIMPTWMACRSTASESIRMPTKSFSCSHSPDLMEAEASSRNTTSAGRSHRTTGTHSSVRYYTMSYSTPGTHSSVRYYTMSYSTPGTHSRVRYYTMSYSTQFRTAHLAHTAV